MKLELTEDKEIIIKAHGSSITLTHEVNSAIWSLEEEREAIAMFVQEKLTREEIETIDLTTLASLYNERKYEFLINNSDMLIEQALRDYDDALSE